MRIALYVVVGVAVVIGAGVVYVATTGRLPGSGCRLTSVDEPEYVAGNRAILDTLPVYPGATRLRTDSRGSIASDKCFPFENSGPYDRYRTYDLYTLPVSGSRSVPAPWDAMDKFGNPVPTRAPSVLLYYDRKLRESGWRGGGTGGCCELYYVKDAAHLFVRANFNADDPYESEPLYEVSVVHDLG